MGALTTFNPPDPPLGASLFMISGISGVILIAGAFFAPIQIARNLNILILNHKIRTAKVAIFHQVILNRRYPALGSVQPVFGRIKTAQAQLIKAPIPMIGAKAMILNIIIETI